MKMMFEYTGFTSETRERMVSDGRVYFTHYFLYLLNKRGNISLPSNLVCKHDRLVKDPEDSQLVKSL
jgi:hypothetical protein